MKPKVMTIERDVQQDLDTRGVCIQEVGISQLKYPLQMSGVERVDVSCQQVSAELSLAVSLAHELKGIHMSRLVENLIAHEAVMTPTGLIDLLLSLKKHQEAKAAKLTLGFDYYLDRQAPVSGRIAKQAYACGFEARLEGSRITVVQKVEVPITTLCPCSKEISAYGAHNQRGYVDVEIEHYFSVEQVPEIRICLEEVIEKVEGAASAPLYPILKRVDERYVTMQAYEQPRFVEDMVRNVAVLLKEDERFDRWWVKVTNHESIHQHNAYAVVSGGR